MNTCGGASFFFMSSGGIWGPFFMSSPPKYLLLGPAPKKNASHGPGKAYAAPNARVKPKERNFAAHHLLKMSLTCGRTIGHCRAMPTQVTVTRRDKYVRHLSLVSD